MTFIDKYLRVKEDHNLTKEEGLALLSEVFEYSVKAASYLRSKRLGPEKIDLAFEKVGAPSFIEIALRIKKKT